MSQCGEGFRAGDPVPGDPAGSVIDVVPMSVAARRYPTHATLELEAKHIMRTRRPLHGNTAQRCEALLFC